MRRHRAGPVTLRVHATFASRPGMKSGPCEQAQEASDHLVRTLIAFCGVKVLNDPDAVLLSRYCAHDWILLKRIRDLIPSCLAGIDMRPITQGANRA